MIDPTVESPEQTLIRIRKSYEDENIRKKVELLEQLLNVSLRHIRACTCDAQIMKGSIENPIGVAQVPLGIIGPVNINGKFAKGSFFVPLATTEGALVLTYDLGAKLLQRGAPVETEVVSKVVHISPTFPIRSNEDEKVEHFIDDNYESIRQVAEGQSTHTKLLAIERRRVKTNFVLTFKYDTADAQGLNMINLATFNACKFIEAKTGAYFYLRSHYSGVKHYSPTNEREGYGRVVKASAIVPSSSLFFLKTSAVKLKDFFDRCWECGTAAGISSVNVHAANAISAIFLACGQDMADMSSAHICATSVDLINQGKDLKISVVLKNLLIATIGGGTRLGTQKECLQMMDCYGSGKSDKFAEIIAATVLAGEIPTAAAVVNRSYVDVHNKYGRSGKQA